MNSDGEAVKERYRKSGTMILEQWSNDGGTVEQGTVMVEQWNSGTETFASGIYAKYHVQLMVLFVYSAKGCNFYM